MKMKRFLAFLVVFLLAFGAISNCKKPAGPGETTIPEEKQGTLEWTQEYVDNLVEAGVVTKDDTKDILREITRGEFLKWLITAKGFQVVDSGLEA